MTPDTVDKRELVHRHSQAELERDWDAALATMVDDPVYEHYPLGVKVRGRDAVREHWERLLAVPEFAARAASARLVEWFTDEVAVQLYEWELDGPDGTKVPSRAWALFTFRDGLIESERIFSDVVMSGPIGQVFEQEFLRRTGVLPIPTDGESHAAQT